MKKVLERYILEINESYWILSPNLKYQEFINLNEMRYRNYKQPKSKINEYKNKKHDKKNKDEMKSAKEDEKNLKKKKKRLTINWFFRPEGD